MPNPFLQILTVLYQIIQFSIGTQFSSIWSIGRTLSGATTPGQSRLWSDGNKEVPHIPQRSCIIGTSPRDYLVSYPGHSLGVGVLPVLYIYIYIYIYIYVCVCVCVCKSLDVIHNKFISPNLTGSSHKNLNKNWYIYIYIYIVGCYQRCSHLYFWFTA